MQFSTITLKMRRTRHGSGNKRTRGYHRSRHRHENKRVRIEERAIEEVRKAKITQVAVSPIPLIDIGIDRIGELIKSVTGVFEDSYQDAWVRVLEEHPSSESEILAIAKKACNANYFDALVNKYESRSLEQTMLQNQKPGHLTLGSTLKANYEPIYTSRIMKDMEQLTNEVSVETNQKPKCKYCSSSKFYTWGKHDNKQRYLCRVCGRTFRNNGALDKMHYPMNIVREFVKLRTMGLSFCRIQKKLLVGYKVKLSTQTLLYWGRKLGVIIKRTDGHWRRDKSQLIQTLQRLEVNTVLNSIDILIACGYSPKTKIEQTQLVKWGFLSKDLNGWKIKVLNE